MAISGMGGLFILVCSGKVVENEGSMATYQVSS